MSHAHWDAVVIGTGFGGSTTALKLATAGARVLVLERGRWVDRDESAWDPRAIQIDRKYKSEMPYDVDERWGRTLTYPDDAVGGKSVFYGAASLRLRSEDFQAARRFAGIATDGLEPMDWPITYEQLEPFYGEAEREIGVAGVAGRDPTEPPRTTGYPAEPAPYGTSARHISATAARLGLKPFPMPLAINFDGRDGRSRCERCMTCDLFPCKIEAKNDLAVTLLPKAKSRGAIIRDRTAAKRLLVADGRIRGVECTDIATGDEFTVQCDLCVVSCGAIASATLLLASGLGEGYPGSQHVGRYLMRHCSGIAIGIFPFRTNPERQFHKQFALTDFYFGQDGKSPAGPWGMIQALQTPPPEFVAETAPYPPPIGWLGAKSLPYHAYLLCMAEDLPNAANRIDLDPSRRDRFGVPLGRVFHRYSKRDLAARKALYREAARLLRKAGALIRVRMPIHTYSHALGSTRFGSDPAHAALDPWCRFFGVPNLFVVDAGFMPSSGGVNPSLTIAANGLRVGQYLAQHWNEVVGNRGA